MGYTWGIHVDHFIFCLQFCNLINLADVSYCQYNTLFALVDKTLKAQLKSFQFFLCICEDLIRLALIKCYIEIFVLVKTPIPNQLVEFNTHLFNLCLYLLWMRFTIQLKKKFNKIFWISEKVQSRCLTVYIWWSVFVNITSDKTSDIWIQKLYFNFRVTIFIIKLSLAFFDV